MDLLELEELLLEEAMAWERVETMYVSLQLQEWLLEQSEFQVWLLELLELEEWLSEEGV